VRRRLALFCGIVAILFTAACVRRGAVGLTSELASARTAEVLRTVADSVYVRSTGGGTIAIVNVPLDTACAGVPRVGDSWCPQVAALWRVDPLSWTNAASAADSADVRAAWAHLLAQRGARMSAASAAFGHPALLAVDSSAVPSPFADYDQWIPFRETHRGAAGALRFSPVGFAPSQRLAIVLVEWRCGPTCGHLAATSLVLAEGGWRVSELLLVATRR